MPGPAYIEPTASGRRNLVLGFSVYLAWLCSHILWLPAAVATIDQANPCRSLGTLQFLWSYALLVCCVPTVFLGRRAWRLHRAGQSPPPDAWVLFRTRVHTGTRLLISKYSLALFAIAWAWLPVLFWQSSDAVAVLFEHGC